MAVAVRLPKMSDEMTEATVSRWLKSVGDSVEKGEPVVEVETEKVIVEVEAPRGGVILEIVAEEQAVVPVDGILCRIGTAGEMRDAAPEAVQPSRPAQPSQPAQSPPRPPPGSATVRAVPSASPSSPVSLSSPASRTFAASPASPVSPDSVVSVSPLARRVAEELRLDLSAVTGTGIGGKIVMADLQPMVDRLQAEANGGNSGHAARKETSGNGGLSTAGPALAPAASAGMEATTHVPVHVPVHDTAHTPARVPAGAPVPPPPPDPTAEGGAEGGEGSEDVLHTALRRSIAKRMSEAKGTIPHFYMTAEIDVTDLLAMRERLNTSLEAGEEGRVSVNDLMIKAVALALLKAPALNASYGEEAVRRYQGVHIAFATAINTASGGGLVTPVVRNCQAKGIGRIARETAYLIDRARRRELNAEELQGGTFTISNLGMYPVTEFSAIINPPQVGILAIARPVERPTARGGEVVLRRMLAVTLSADHRAVDGVAGAEFLQALKTVLETPERMML